HPRGRRAAPERFPPLGKRLCRAPVRGAHVAGLRPRRSGRGPRRLPRARPALRRAPPCRFYAVHEEQMTTTALATLWLSSMAVAGFGTWVLFDASIGLNWSLWMTLSAASLGLAGRGAAMALPVITVLALLPAGADPILARARDTVLELIERVDFIPRLVFFGALLAGALGAGGVTLREGAVPRTPRPIQPSAAR